MVTIASIRVWLRIAARFIVTAFMFARVIALVMSAQLLLLLGQALPRVRLLTSAGLALRRRWEYRQDAFEGRVNLMWPGRWPMSDPQSRWGESFLRMVHLYHRADLAAGRVVGRSFAFLAWLWWLPSRMLGPGGRPDGRP